MSSRLRRRIIIALFISYSICSIGGAWLQQSRLSIAALILLLTALALLMLRWRQPLTSALWLLIALPLLAAIASGHASLALDAVPIVVNIALAWLFGHTLAAGEQPLVARLICIIEEPQRLQLPGVARYARQLTWFWTLLLGAQSLLLLALALCVVPDGVLVSLGFDSPWPLAPVQVAWYTRIGTYLVPLATMVLEYAWRRWHLRHIPHPGVRQFITRMVTSWPQMLGHDGSPR